MSCATSANPQHHLKAVPSPEAGIEIRIAHLDSILPEEIEQLFASLDASERESAAHFRFSQDRHRYVAAHSLLRHVLATTLGCHASTLVLEKSAQGKPELRQNENAQRHLKFNLSHAAGWALIAIGWDRELGVDLESAESLPDDDQSFSKLAARILSEPELEIWKAIPSPEKRRAAFLQTWTRKEAYVKAIGEGLRHDFAEIDATRPSRRWIVHDLPVPAKLTAALAVEAC